MKSQKKGLLLVLWPRIPDIPKKILDIASDTDVGKPVNVVKAALGYTMFRVMIWLH